MKKIIVTQFVVLLLAIAPGSYIFSQQGRGLGPCGAGFGPGNNPYCRMLDLTEDQMDQMKEIRLEQSETLKPIHAEFQKIRVEYRELISVEDEDLDAINKNIDKLTELQNKIMKMNVQYRKKMEDVLTEEQKKLRDSEFPASRGFYGKGNPPGRGYGQGFGRGMGKGYGRGHGRGYGAGFRGRGSW